MAREELHHNATLHLTSREACSSTAGLVEAEFSRHLAKPKNHSEAVARFANMLSSPTHRRELGLPASNRGCPGERLVPAPVPRLR